MGNAACKEVKPFAERLGTFLNRSDLVDLLAIDPGMHTGWAGFSKEDLRSCGTGRPPLRLASVVIVELPQIYPGHPVPPNDLVNLAFLAGRYAGASTGKIYTVAPHAWKGNLPKDVCNARVLAKLDAVERGIVEGCDVPKGQKHNVIDAIGIGLFFLGRYP